MYFVNLNKIKVEDYKIYVQVVYPTVERCRWIVSLGLQKEVCSFISKKLFGKH